MNFTDLNFWALLLAALGVCQLLRLAVGAALPGWLRVYDHLALATINLTLFFHADALSCVILVCELVLTYALMQVALRSGRAMQFASLAVLVLLHLGVLGYFKYAGFILHDLLHLPWHDAPRSIPAGISFYTFQKLALAIDTVRRQRPLPRPLDFVNYSTFFPQLVAGPIERRDALLPQIERFSFRPSLDNFQRAIPLIVLGLFYKIVLADNLGAYERRDYLQNAWMIWWTNGLFGLRIYFDFAGYSFIALGLARAFGVGLTLNFRAPYSSVSIREFWQRWHITLSTWFRDYVYLPLGGNRSGSWVFNIAVVFLVSGLWHGAGLNFILWGAMHAALMIAASYAVRVGLRVPTFAARALTLVAVFFSWLLFYETNVHNLAQKAAALLQPAEYRIANLRELFVGAYVEGDRVPLAFIVLLALLILVIEFRSRARENPYTVLLDWRVTCLLAFLITQLAFNGDSPFIYFAF